MVSLKQRAAAKLKLMDMAEESETSFPTPQAGAQEMFLATNADIALYGGAAGGGKTFALLMDFAKEELISCPEYRAVIFRRSYPQIMSPGGLWDESANIYPTIGAKPKQSAVEWKFPSNAQIVFRHLGHENTKYEWQGAQIPVIGFDELTHFSESLFWYLVSRNRSPSGIPTKIRCTTNPDADSWVASFIDWWIGDDGLPLHERAGVIRWFIRDKGEILWADTPEELLDLNPNQQPKSFTFIPATIQDNTILMEKDPSYLGNLQAQHPVERARLLEGNWKARFDSGTIFNREWFDVVDHAPIGQCVRFWDIAATAQEMAKSSSYYTAGVKMSKSGGCYFVLDAIAEQKGAGAVEALIIGVARQDGKKVKVRWEQEGGSAGILWCENLKDRLIQLGFDADYIKPMGDKVSRSIPYATDAVDGKVSLVRDTWNDTYLNALQHFDGTPAPLINDLTDASTGAHTFLSTFAFQNLPAVKKQENSPAQLRKVF